MLQNSPKQFESVLQVANQNTEFLDSPAMQRCLEASDFELSDLKTSRDGHQPLSLPAAELREHALPLAADDGRAQRLRDGAHPGPAEGGAGAPVLFVLDEFAGLKRMSVIENAVAQIAGHGGKLWFVLQSLEQLKAVYKDNWETFLSNAGLKIFFGIEDHFTREYVSKLVGETEIIREVRSESDSTSESESHGRSSVHGNLGNGGDKPLCQHRKIMGVQHLQRPFLELQLDAGRLSRPALAGRIERPERVAGTLGNSEQRTIARGIARHVAVAHGRDFRDFRDLEIPHGRVERNHPEARPRYPR